KAIALVSLDPAEAPMFGGKFGRERMAALLLSVSYFESGWRRDVHLGIGKLARGDSGRSWCLMQIHIRKGPPQDGWDGPRRGGARGPELVASRERCLRAGLHILRRSARACSQRPLTQWLNAYASGTCERGENESRARVDTAIRWFTQHPPPPKTEEGL